jgi:predicted Zn-dependent protease
LKYILAFLILGILFALLFPRRVPRLVRGAGRVVGDLGRVGQELATGEEVRNSPLARHEVRAGELLAIKFLTQNPMSADRDLQAWVAEIGSRLARHAQRREIPYRFSVVDSEEPNAVAVPGGSIFVTRPLLELCEWNPDRIAGVLGHELVHVDRWHSVRALAATVAVRTGARLFAIGRAAMVARVARGMEELLVRGYGQDRELEADALGVRVARLAGFDPRGLVQLLERLRAERPDGKGMLADVMSYFQTHPPLALRLESLEKELKRGERP